MIKSLKLKSHNQNGFGNRKYTVIADFEFNGQTIKKGLMTDGGSTPKIFIIALLLILSTIYGFNYFLDIVIFAVAIDESSGWFQKPFFLHDQHWHDATSWGDIFKANGKFYNNMIFKVSNYENENIFKYFFHVSIGYLLAIVYPLAVSTFGLIVAFFKLKNKGKQWTT